MLQTGICTGFLQREANTHNIHVHSLYHEVRLNNCQCWSPDNRVLRSISFLLVLGKGCKISNNTSGSCHKILTHAWCGAQLGYRFLHVLRRMLPIAMFLLQRDGQFLNGHDLFLKRVGSSYHAFLEETERGCRGKCLEDLQSTTRYVTWSLHTKSRASLKSMLNRVSES